MQKLVGIILLFLMTSCSYLMFWEDDNPVEETIEDVIRRKTGVDIDFTGKTPEFYKKYLNEEERELNFL